MKFEVTGADRDTGDTIAMTIEAPDEEAAERAANKKGIMVSQVELVRKAPAKLAPAATVAPRVEQGHARGAPVINVAMPRRGNSLGVASLVLGVLAFLICWIPLINLLGVPLSGLGLLLGVIGIIVALTRRGSGIGFPIAGSAVCALALAVAVGMTTAIVSGGLRQARTAVRESKTNQSSGSPVPHEKSGLQWAMASGPVTQGDIQVQIKAVRVGKVPLKERFSDDATQSKDELLAVEIEVTNLSTTKKVDYRTWGGDSTSILNHTVLKDNHDNRYRVIDFGFGSSVVGAIESEALYPGKTVQDVLVFEKPVADLDYLNLELPASQFRGEGMLRIRIPASMIQR